MLPAISPMTLQASGSETGIENKLLRACRDGDETALFEAIDQHYPINGNFLRIEGGFITALGMAVEKGHVEIVKILLKQGAETDTPSMLPGRHRGQTPLEAAKERLDKEIGRAAVYKKHS